MADIGRPRGLIDYATLEDCKHEATGGKPQSPWKTLRRPRTLVYGAIWLSIGAALLIALGVRTHTEITVSPDRNPPFMLMRDGSVRNAYTLKLRNMESRPRTMQVEISGLAGATMWTDSITRENAATSQQVEVPADATRTVRAYVLAPANSSEQSFTFTLTSLDEQRESDTAQTLFTTPGGNP